MSERTRNGPFTHLLHGLESTMPHRRTSGAKVRSHKIGIGNARYAKGKQARLQNRKMLAEYFRIGEMVD